MLASAAAIALWTAGAIYFDVGRGAKWRWLPTVGWCVAVGTLFVLVQPLWLAFAIFLGIFLLFLGWWLSQKPRHDRDWDPSVAVLPRADVRDGVVTIENVRNNEYRAFDDFTPRYETRSYHLANLVGADVIFFYWGSPWMSHPVLVFDFGPDGRVCMSIEVRYRKGQKYSILRSLYRQQELIFTVADERDAILRRTKHGRINQAYLYRLTATVDELRAAFLDYVNGLNSIYERPRWYHGLCANCTTNFYRLPSSQWRCDWRVIANGRLDRALYEAGRLDRSLPFEELRRTGYISDLADAAPADGFGDHIRREIARKRDER
jgi:hypothetical protein